MTMERDTLMREVDEEVRREQIQKLWEQYGTYIVAGVALFVAGVGGYQWWQGRQISAVEAAGQRFEQALNLIETGKDAEAKAQLAAIAATRQAGYAELAQLSLAGAAVKAGKLDEALAAFEAVAKSADDTLIKDFARLQVASLKIETADWTEMQNRLNDLIGEKNPWRFLAREALGLSAMRTGKLAEARQTLAPLSADPRAPAAVRERASALMNIVVATEQQQTAPAKVELEATDAPPAKPEPTAKPEAGVKAPAPKGGAPKK